MLAKDDVESLFTLILDRACEDEALIDRLRRGDSLRAAALELLASDEFVSRNRVGLVRLFGFESEAAALL